MILHAFQVRLIMKVKLKNKDKMIPRWNSFCGLDTNKWEQLNNKEIVELEKIPDSAKEFVQKVEEKK